MKIKKWMLGITSMILGLIASIFAFFPMFGLKGTIATTTIVSDMFFGLFTKPSENMVNILELVDVEYNGAFKIIAAVLSFIVLLCVVAYIATFFADLKKNKLAELRKVLSFVLIILGVIISICLIIFVATNSGSVSNVNAKIYGSNVFATIAITLFTVLAGLAAYFAEKEFVKKEKPKAEKPKAETKAAPATKDTKKPATKETPKSANAKSTEKAVSTKPASKPATAKKPEATKAPAKPAAKTTATKASTPKATSAKSKKK